mmetsp:Transcript_16494/g.44874  ORF Transcript_16494/g.44874 Transcript_16494/m.44874 type:complete len:268 (+) Transcript_16494:251-1054(+)
MRQPCSDVSWRIVFATDRERIVVNASSGSAAFCSKKLAAASLFGAEGVEGYSPPPAWNQTSNAVSPFIGFNDLQRNEIWFTSKANPRCTNQHKTYRIATSMNIRWTWTSKKLPIPGYPDSPGVFWEPISTGNTLCTNPRSSARRSTASRRSSSASAIRHSFRKLSSASASQPSSRQRPTGRSSHPFAKALAELAGGSVASGAVDPYDSSESTHAELSSPAANPSSHGSPFTSRCESRNTVTRCPPGVTLWFSSSKSSRASGASDATR